MFIKLAKIDAGRAHVAPAPAFAHQNDNRPDRCREIMHLVRLQRLACHWRPAATDGRLECYWQIEAADETETPGRSFVIGTAASAVQRAAANAVTRGPADGRAA
jgi:hypothetical protein